MCFVDNVINVDGQHGWMFGPAEHHHHNILKKQVWEFSAFKYISNIVESKFHKEKNAYFD